MKTITPIRARSRNELFTLVDKVAGRADVLEIWLDQILWMPSYIEDIKKREPNVKLLGVCKTPAEHGTFEKNSEKKLQILQDFLDSGGDWVDLDINNNELKAVKTIDPNKLWLSIHDFERVPENLEEIHKMMQFFRPFGVKFAMTPRTPVEYKSLLDFAALKKPVQSYYSRNTNPEIIVTTMGEHFGTLGRQEIEMKDLSWGAFYALSKDHVTANGQMTLSSLEN